MEDKMREIGLGIKTNYVRSLAKKIKKEMKSENSVKTS
jgi:hypothetical protein